MKELILNFKRETKSFNKILEIYQSKISGYAKRYICNIDISNELICFLYEILIEIDVSKFKSEELIEHYINKCLKNKYLQLVIKQDKVKSFEINIDNISYTDKLECIEYNKNESDLYFHEMIKTFNKEDRELLILRYYYLLSDNEIAKLRRVSRQAIFKRRTMLLSILKRQQYKYL